MFDAGNPAERFPALGRIAGEHPFRIIPVSVEDVLRWQEVRHQRWRQKPPPDDPDGTVVHAVLAHRGHHFRINYCYFGAG